MQKGYYTLKEGQSSPKGEKKSRGFSQIIKKICNTADRLLLIFSIKINLHKWYMRISIGEQIFHFKFSLIPFLLLINSLFAHFLP